MENFLSKQEEIKRRIDYEIISHSNIDDRKMYEIIDGEIENNQKYLSIKDKLELRKNLFYSYRGFGILEEFLEDSNISEIMINGYQDIFIEKNAKVEKVKKGFESKQQLEDLIQQVVSRFNRVINTANPIVDARLEDGSRVNIVLDSIALNGPIVTIRKFPKRLKMKDLIDLGAISENLAKELADLVCSGYNIFISGGTNSGKTTFLNALSEFIPEDERVITIEDSAELYLENINNIVKLEAKNASCDGQGEVSISDLIKTALRMNPDRIVVGEVRGKEALDMLQAMNTGHDGSISTGHANSPKDMLLRLETMVLMASDLPLNAVRAQIASAIDIVIHLGRLRDRKRRVLSLLEILGFDDGKIKTNLLYEYEEENDKLIKKNNLQKKEKLKREGVKLL